MGFFTGIQSGIGRFASILLDIDDTEQPRSQMRALHDFLGKQVFDAKSADLHELLLALKKKHLVDSITIASLNGGVLASTDGRNQSTFNETALYNYVRTELPCSEVLFVKCEDWFMAFQFNNRVYLVKAGNNLSTIELKALARDIDDFLLRERQVLEVKSREAELTVQEAD